MHESQGSNQIFRENKSRCFAGFINFIIYNLMNLIKNRENMSFKWDFLNIMF